MRRERHRREKNDKTKKPEGQFDSRKHGANLSGFVAAVHAKKPSVARAAVAR